jgi:hypothetical protein
MANREPDTEQLLASASRGEAAARDRLLERNRAGFASWWPSASIVA